MRNLALGTYITNDDKTYHAAIIAQWLRNGKSSIVASTYQAYSSLNDELLGLWFMLPFGHDGAVPLNGLIYLAQFIALGLHFADQLNVSKRWQLLPTILVLASTPIFFGIISFTNVDFSSPVLVLAAVAFLLAALKNADRSIGWPLALIGATCAGFGVGMKILFALPIGILFLVFATTALQRCHLPKAIDACCLAWSLPQCTARAATFVFQELATDRENPFYPAAIGPFEGPFGAVDQDPTKLASVIVAGLDREQWQQLFDGFVNRPLPISVVVVLGCFAGLFSLFRRREISANQRLIVISLICVAAAATAFFPITPFSGTNQVGGLESTGRYLNLFTWSAVYSP